MCILGVPTRYKNSEKLSSIDLLLSSRPKSFQSSPAVETGLSDLHKMTVIFMKTNFEKDKLRVAYFRNWNEFCNEHFTIQSIN